MGIRILVVTPEHLPPRGASSGARFDEMSESTVSEKIVFFFPQCGFQHVLLNVVHLPRPRVFNQLLTGSFWNESVLRVSLTLKRPFSPLEKNLLGWFTCFYHHCCPSVTVRLKLMLRERTLCRGLDGHPREFSQELCEPWDTCWQRCLHWLLPGELLWWPPPLHLPSGQSWISLSLCYMKRPADLGVTWGR